MIYFAQKKLGIYLNGFDWAHRNDGLIKMLHPIPFKVSCLSSQSLSISLVLEGFNDNITNLPPYEIEEREPSI